MRFIIMIGKREWLERRRIDNFSFLSIEKVLY